jgi:lipopolysaccharide/colanic/teichoic acid biosynthesis glycosyltransferase
MTLSPNTLFHFLHQGNPDFANHFTDGPGSKLVKSASWLIIDEDDKKEPSAGRTPANCSSFIEAETFLWLCLRDGHNLPQAIIVDRCFEPTNLKYFQRFLNSNAKLAAIPVLHTESRLTESDISELKEKSLIDDFVSLTANNFAQLPDFFEAIRTLKERVRETKNSRTFSRNDIARFSAKGLNSISKRLFDIVVSATLLLVLSPIMLLIALIIRLESKGSPIYISKRAGRGYRVFKFYKFRTMVKDADRQITQFTDRNKYGASQTGPSFIKLENDPRVTRVGAVLRWLSLDELPQFINVLKGDMSIVGNRPLPLYEAETLTTDEHAERFMARAGITGLWQIKKKEKPNMSAQERIQIDITYARNQNWLNDVLIMLKTPAALLQQPNT